MNSISPINIVHCLSQIIVLSNLIGLHGGKVNSLARSNASLYGTKEDLYDRLKRHAYTGKKGKFD